MMGKTLTITNMAVFDSSLDVPWRMYLSQHVIRQNLMRVLTPYMQSDARLQITLQTSLLPSSRRLGECDASIVVPACMR